MSQVISALGHGSFLAIEAKLGNDVAVQVTLLIKDKLHSKMANLNKNMAKLKSGRINRKCRLKVWGQAFRVPLTLILP